MMLTLSITQLNNYIKRIIDSEELLFDVSVYGEVTNFKLSNGIAYFDIKEEGAQLSCVKFSSYAPFAKNGDKVVVTGRLNYHVKLGRLSFIVSKIEAYGMGELYKQFLELKARLEAEGLFDPAKKKPIPTHASTVGVVTSETGAVIRDIYHVTRKKNPTTNLLVYPVKVQGVGAENEIAAGIEYFNKAKNVDVIIVARGGGSFEDLAPFNTEKVARAAFASELPIISGVGHETDFSILDFASDMRAPTPSVAADIAVYDYYNERMYLTQLVDKIKADIQRLTAEQKQRAGLAAKGISREALEIVKQAHGRAEKLGDAIASKIEGMMIRARGALEMVSAKLEKSNPLSILRAGYAKVMVGGKSAKFEDIRVGDEMETVFNGGKVVSEVKSVKEIKL